MIEVLFGKSEACSMQVAKSGSAIISQRDNGPTASIGNPPASEDTTITWIPGKSNEVICLELMLDMGDIRQEVSCQCQKELNRLKTYIENGESIRIWYSKSPYSICGLYFLCKWMNPYKNKTYVVLLPEYKVNKNSITSYQSWGEVAAEKFSHFLQFQKELSLFKRSMYAGMWNALVEDNSPLRVVLNNQVLGVAEDFYDFLIWRKLDETPVMEARLIGDILGKFQIGVGDKWYATRIQHLIDDHKIEILQDSENEYSRIIRKCTAD